MQRERRKGNGAWAALAVTGMFLLISLAMNLALLGKSADGKFNRWKIRQQPVDQAPQLEEEWSYGYGTVKVVRIALEGLIMRGGEQGLLFKTPDPVETVLRQIRAAQNDPLVRAIIMEISSPGGGVTPSDEIYMALRGFRESDPARKVIIFVRELAASGGYYVAMAADRIVAEPTAMVGSVGVLMQTLNLAELSRKIGISDVTLTSGPNKDLLNPWRPVNPEHQRILQELVDDSYRRFAAIVMEARGLPDTALLDGRILPASRALEARLIDEVGYWPHAVAATARLLGEDDVRVVRYFTRSGWTQLLTGVKMPLNLRGMLPSTQPRLLYLWKP